MKILIIGGNGFIGSHLVEILKEDHQVTVFDRSKNDFLNEDPGVRYIYGDFNNIVKLRAALEGQDIVYHLISTTVPLTADQDPIMDIRSNLIGTINLLQLIGEEKVGRLIFASSGGTVYGEPEYLPIDESHPCNPLGSYGIVKYAVENYIKLYAKKYNFSYLIARPSNPYGPRQNFSGNQGFIAKFIFTGLTNSEFTILGDGSSTRDFIYINDLVDFLKLAGLSDNSGTINVGSGEGKSLKEIMGILSSIMEVSPNLKYKPANPFAVKEVVLDIKNARETFSWEPSMSIEDGLANQYNWMKSIFSRT